jgi:hypothetical protein
MLKNFKIDQALLLLRNNYLFLKLYCLSFGAKELSSKFGRTSKQCSTNQ